MESRGPRLSLKTDGLDEDWLAVAGEPIRVDRGLVLIGELGPIVDEVHSLNPNGLDCRLLLQMGTMQLVLELRDARLFASDPDDPNYHNVPVDREFLEEFLRDRFLGENLESIQAPDHVRIIEWSVLAVFLVLLGVSGFYLSRHLNRGSLFLPLPSTVEFENRSVAQTYMRQYSGIYATQIRDGEMAIELQPDGRFAYYDLSRTSPSYYRLKSVNMGSVRPVLEEGRLAFLTDSRFVFYPVTDGTLEFQQRSFSRIAQDRMDLPYFRFPE